MAKPPKVLLISELPLGYSQGDRHVNPILYNLFCEFAPEGLLQLTVPRALRDNPPAEGFATRTLAVREELIPNLRNRLGLRLKPFVDRINRQLLNWLPLATLNAIETFKPDLIVAVPITPWASLLADRLATQLGAPLVVYFMDHPAIQDQQGVGLLPGQTAAALTKRILAKAKGWLVISEALKTQLTAHYGVQPPPTLTVTNTIDLTSLAEPKYPTASIAREAKAFRVVYAGSIQPMHFDAVAKIAAAIAQLRQANIGIEFVLHTLPVFWETYAAAWRQWGVTNGGLVAYADLHDTLQRADLLLVATSFLPANEAVVRSSVLTKTFDYMATGRPILSYGPTYSANNQFVERWQCGFVSNCVEVNDLRDYLLGLTKATDQATSYAKQAYGVLRDHFDRRATSLQLKEFLSGCASQVEPRL